MNGAARFEKLRLLYDLHVGQGLPIFSRGPTPCPHRAGHSGRPADGYTTGAVYNCSSRAVNRVTLALQFERSNESAASVPVTTERFNDVVVSPIGPLEAGDFTTQIGGKEK